MTKTIKTVITFVITVVMFAAMTANAFADIVPGMGGAYANAGTGNHVVGGYAEKYMWDTCFANAYASSLGSVQNESVGTRYDYSDRRATVITGNHTTNAISMAQLMYHAIHAEECGYDCSGSLCSVSKKYPSSRYNPVHFGNVIKQADAIEAEFGDEITRAEAAMIIYRAAQEAGFTGKPELEDEDHCLIIDDLNDAPEEYREAIQFVMDNGLMDYPYSDKPYAIGGSKVLYYNCLVPLPELGFQPNTLLKADEALASSMYLYYTLNDVDINARKMYYNKDNAAKSRELMQQAVAEADAGLYK